MNGFFRELKRRNVFKVGVAYAIVAWVILQFVDVVADTMNFPDWIAQAVLMVLIAGLPIALLFSWAYEVTPEGVMKTAEVDASKSITHGTGQKINKLIAVGFVLALGFIAYDKLIAPDGRVVNQVEAGSASIAVLPFTNLSGLPENDPFTNGLHDDLLTQLSKIESLKVISRTSVLEYRNTTKNMKEIADELGVTTLMEGGVQRAGDRVRINVQLIDAATDQHIWAETYDREMTVANIFDVQSEIARNITTQLKATFNPEEEARIAKVPTENLKAYEAYLNGMAFLSGGIADTSLLPLAGEEFKKAIELDPNFALAYAGLSQTYITTYWFSNQRETLRFVPLAREAADRALELDPDLLEGHSALGSYYYWGFLDYDNALVELNLAIEGGLRTPGLYLNRGSVNRRQGNWDAAISDFETAIALDPRDATANWAIGGIYAQLKRYSDGRRYYGRAVALAPDSYFFKIWIPAYEYIAFNNPDPYLALKDDPTFEYDLSFSPFYPLTLLNAGRYQELLDYLERADNGGRFTRSDNNVLDFAYFYRGSALKGLGQEEEGMKYLNLALMEIEKILVENPDSYNDQDTKANILLALGRVEEALELARANRAVKSQEEDVIGNLLYETTLLSALAANDLLDETMARLDVYLGHVNAWSLAVILKQPYMRNIQSHEGFPALLAKYGLIWEDQSEGAGNE